MGRGCRGSSRPLNAHSRRSEYNAFWKCVQAGVTYLFVQLCKMLFLATFFPTWEGGIYDFIGVSGGKGGGGSTGVGAPGTCAYSSLNLTHRSS